MAFLIHQLMLNKAGQLAFNGIRDLRSPGCGKTVPSTPITSSYVNGVTRNYITEIGNKYTKDTPIKLILAFHGRTNSNEQVRSYYDINDEANGNAIIIYPSGLPEATSPRNRSDGGDISSQLRDFALFDQIVKDFTENYCIDMDQIYVVGHSLGAWFTNSLSCARGNVIRAIGSV
jgi:polyhydroxybutyrate depolymerase